MWLAGNGESMINTMLRSATGLVKFYLTCADSQDGVANLFAALLKPIILAVILCVQMLATIDTWYDFHTGGIE